MGVSWRGGDEFSKEPRACLEQERGSVTFEVRPRPLSIICYHSIGLTAGFRVKNENELPEKDVGSAPSCSSQFRRHSPAPFEKLRPRCQLAPCPTDYDAEVGRGGA